MHSRRKGKSKSVKPNREESPEWVTLSKQEIEEIIVKLAREGNTPSKIGLILRDQYGVPDVRPIMGMKLTHVLEKNSMGLKLPEDLQSLINKSVALSTHIGRHKKDNHNKRALLLMESKIRRLTKYYIRSGKLPEDWRYDPEQARLLVSK
jgi:small subunit ribosomal protein S15